MLIDVMLIKNIVQLESTPQVENIPWRGKNIWGGANERLEGQKYTKYNKIDNNSENFKGARLLPGGLRSPGPP